MTEQLKSKVIVWTLKGALIPLDNMMIFDHWYTMCGKLMPNNKN